MMSLSLQQWMKDSQRGLLLLVFAVLSAVPLQLTAQDGEEAAEEQETRRTGAISEKTYKKLAEAQELAEAEPPNYSGALAILRELDDGKRSPYELANIYNFIGFIYYSQDRYQDSINAYNKVLAQPEIPRGLIDSTRYTICQLYFTIENWTRSESCLREWLSAADNPPPEAYQLLATAIYQQERYGDMIQPMERAIAIARERDIPIKENWWLLLRAGYYEIDNFNKVREILEILVSQWPKKDYWTTLSGVYGELGQESRQVAAYQAAYDQGMLTSSAELVQMAQLFLGGDAPYKAAKVLEDGLESGAVEKNAENYRLLAQAWQLSAEDTKAIPALRSAAGLSSDGDLDARLASSYLNLGDYRACIASARNAVNKGGLKRADNNQVVLGMCLYETDQFDAAKTAFRAAARDERSEKTGTQWISHIDREVARITQLNKALEDAKRKAESF